MAIRIPNFKPEMIFLLRFRYALEYRYSQSMATDFNARKDPARKRTFNPERDVALMLHYWGRANPNVIEARMINEALRRHLKVYERKRVPAILRMKRNGKAPSTTERKAAA